jgi:hypothetical protein
MTAVALDTALEALRVTTDLLDAALETHIFDASKDAVAMAASDEARQISINRNLLAAPQRLSLLASIKNEAPMLLLGSFHKTHADVLRWDTFIEDYSLGIRTSLGDFTHLPSGIRYLVVVAPIPAEA